MPLCILAFSGCLTGHTPSSGSTHGASSTALRAAGDVPLSGESLSGLLEVSRAQIWKHVEALRAAGYRVRKAADGSAGLAAVKLAAPALVVTDICMPGTSGAVVIDIG